MAISSGETGRFEVRIQGESIEPGKIAIRDLERLSPLLQNGLERTARVLRQEPGGLPGPVPQEVRIVTNLLLVGIQPGSAQLLLELPVPEEARNEEGLFERPPRDLGQRAMDVFVRGLHDLETGASTEVPEGWDNSIMEVAESLAAFARERGYAIEFDAHPSERQHRRALITPDAVERFSVRHAPIRQRRSARGRLFLVDLKSGRIDIEDEKGQRIQCHFPAELEQTVKSLIGETVLAAGEQEVDLALNRVGKLEVSTLQQAPEALPLADDFWLNKSAGEQAAEQDVAIISSVDDFAAVEFASEELDHFIDAIRDIRREE